LRAANIIGAKEIEAIDEQLQERLEQMATT
jgi:hypothetical protein